jgi:hypothetical protein
MATPTGTKAITIDPYSSTTGAGTLSYYANKYGTTVQNLQTLNPTITNPNLIQKGAALNVPTFNQPAVVTSQAGNNAMTKANETINSNSAPSNTQTQLYTGGSAINDGKAPIGYKDSTGKVTYYSTPDTGAATTDKTATPEDPNSMSSQVNQINAAGQAYVDNATAELNSYKTGLDKQTQTMIDQITQKYSQRIADQTKINNGYLGSTRVAGIMSGRDRYASELNDQIMSNEETAGLQRIRDLETERESLITQARQASDEKSRSATVDLANKLEQNRKDRQSAVSELYKQSIDFQKLSLDKAKESRQQVADNITNSKNIADNIAGSLVDQFDTNKLDKAAQDKMIEEYANSYGVTPDFVVNAIKDFRRQDQTALPEVIKEYNYMKDNFGYTGSPIDYQRTKKQAVSIATGKTNPVINASAISRYGLPKTLDGMSQKEIILDTLVSKPPQWFVQAKIADKTIPAGATTDVAQASWDTFRNNPDLKVFQNELDTNKAGKDNAMTDQQLMDQLLNGVQ